MPKPLKHPPAVTSSELNNRLTKAKEWTAKPNELKGEFPWDSANARVKVGYQLRMDEPLHAKLKFLVDNEPKTSMHKIIIDAVNAEVARRLVKYIGEEDVGK